MICPDPGCYDQHPGIGPTWDRAGKIQALEDSFLRKKMVIKSGSVLLYKRLSVYIYICIYTTYMCIAYSSIWFSGIYWGLFQKLGDSKHVVPPIYCNFNGGNRMKNNQNWGVPKIFQTNPSLASGKPTGKVLKEKEVKSILPLHKFECIQMTGRSPTKMGRQNVGWNQQKGDATSKQSAPLAGVIVLHVQNHRHLLNGMDWSIDLVMCQGKYQQNGWSYHEMTEIGGLGNLAFARHAHFVPFTAGTNNNGCWPLATQFQLSAFFHPFP